MATWQSVVLWCSGKRIPLWLPSAIAHTNILKHHMYHCLKMLRSGCVTTELRCVLKEKKMLKHMCVCVSFPHIIVHLLWLHQRRNRSKNRSLLLNQFYSSAVFYSFFHQENNKRKKKSRQREWEQDPPSFQERPRRVWGLGKIRLIWRSFKERQAVQLRRGASEQVQGEQLGLHRCEVVAPTLPGALHQSLPSTTSLLWPTYQPGGGRGGGLPFFHYWYHCITQPELIWTKSAEKPLKVREPQADI